MLNGRETKEKCNGGGRMEKLQMQWTGVGVRVVGMMVVAGVVGGVVVGMDEVNGMMGGR